MLNTAQKFSGNKAEGKKYATQDFRYLKNKYQVDEVLFVNLNWGALISYYSMIETGRSGYANFDTKLINTADNSLIFANNSVNMVPIKGKWNVGPEYQNAVGTIKEALDKGAETEKTLFK